MKFAAVIGMLIYLLIGLPCLQGLSMNPKGLTGSQFKPTPIFVSEVDHALPLLASSHNLNYQATSHRASLTNQWSHWLKIVVPSTALLAICSKFLPKETVVQVGMIILVGLFALEAATIFANARNFANLNLPQAATNLNLSQAATNLNLSQAATNLNLPQAATNLNLPQAVSLPKASANLAIAAVLVAFINGFFENRTQHTTRSSN